MEALLKNLLVPQDLKWIWQKESKKPDALYIDIFKKTKVADANVAANCQPVAQLIEDLNKVPVNPRMNDLAKCYKNAGNDELAQGKLLNAMFCYNLSLSSCEPGSEYTSLALANRSFIFLRLKMYEKCLIDIERAIQANYPQHLMSKLEQRRQVCLEMMKNSDRVEENTPKLDYEADSNFPGMANVLQINYNQKFGRHIIAKCDIEAGKTVLVEEAYVQQTRIKECRNCTTCLKILMNFIPCDDCTYAVFCDDECKNKNEYHHLECEDLGYNIGDAVIHYSVRSILIAIDTIPDVTELMKFVEDAVKSEVKEAPQPFVDKKAKYRAFLKQDISSPSSPTDGFNHIQLGVAYNVYMNLLKRRIIKEKFDTKAKRHFLMHLVVYHHRLIKCNSKIREKDAMVALHPTLDLQYSEGIFLVHHYLKQSKKPNLKVSDYGNLSVAITTRPIKEGEQLFVGKPRSRDYQMDHLLNMFSSNL